MLALSKPANATEAPVEMASAEPMLADVATASQVAAVSTEAAITAPVEPAATISPVDVPAPAVPLAPAAPAVSARSEEHKCALQSLLSTTYSAFCFKHQ